MSYQITIQPSGHQFVAQAGQTVLDAAIQAGLIIPYSCRSGSCASCKGRVIEGKLQEGSCSTEVLDSQEISEGYVLFCQAKPISDLQIEVREVRLASEVQIRKMPVRVMNLEKKTDDVMIVSLQMPANEPFRFYPGQYIEFILKDGVRRCYSIANKPNENNQVDLHIRHMPGGVFTDHVFGAGQTAMKVREILRIEGPMGTFFLREDSDKPMIFLASGTGFAPLKAIMETVIAKGITRPIHFYWGGRRPQDLYLNELAMQWSRELPFFKYIPVISDAVEEDHWQGRVGFVHKAVIQDFPDLSGYEVYACGAPIVIESARHDFCHECGLDENYFYADSFTSEKDR